MGSDGGISQRHKILFKANRVERTSKAQQRVSRASKVGFDAGDRMHSPRRHPIARWRSRSASRRITHLKVAK